MKPISRRIITIATLVVVFLLFSAAAVHAYTANETANDLGNTAYAPSVSRDAPEPEKDTCFQCHITGEYTNLWTATARWAVFGVAGLVFLFGVIRSVSVWRTRKAWKPIPTRVMEWVDERYQLSEFLEPILSKPVPEWQRRWWYCLGGLTFFLFLVQGATGIMLAFYYKATPETAYASIQFIETEVRLGAAIRAIHHWSANGMIIMAVAHMLRVFIMGAYKKPRELNWISGAVLLIVTLAFGFTGYLLPWDQRAYWASTVGTEIAGGMTLSRFYALHVLIIPIITVGTMLMHFIMVRKQGVMKPL